MKRTKVIDALKCTTYGSDICVKGWVRSKRGSKGIFFIAQNDISTGGLWLCKAALIVASLPLGLIFARIFTDTNFRKSS